MIGILLAGGAGTRLFPVTLGVSKQLLPVYDKPAIFYPLSVLMLAGIRKVVVISTPRDLPSIQNLLGDGSRFGIELIFLEQAKPAGIPEAFTIAEKYVPSTGVTMILGDNLFYGSSVPQALRETFKKQDGATIFAYRVQDPQRFGVVELSPDGVPLSIEEKPIRPNSNWAVTGLYRYDGQVCDLVRELKPSARGELEISDLNREYLKMKKLSVVRFGRGVAWLDTGTPESMLSSSIFVQTIEQRQGLKIACLEEIALNQGFISKDNLASIIGSYPKGEYRAYLQSLLN